MLRFRAPRRIVTSNSPLPANVATTAAEPQPEVAIVEEVVDPVRLLDGRAARWPVYSHDTFPTDVNAPYRTPPAPEPYSAARRHPDAEAVIEYFDLAPGAKMPLHRTTSTDYVTFIAGEVILGVPAEAYDLALDKPPRMREVLCRPGDVVMQRGTLHSWENPSPTDWAYFMGISLRARAVEVPVQQESEGRVLGDVPIP